ncbi:hypothetical protein AAY473_021110 [Plecturocebus cupreus]
MLVHSCNPAIQEAEAQESLEPGGRGCSTSEGKDSRVTEDRSNNHKGLTYRIPIPSPSGLYLSDELREAEDRPVVEDWIIKDIGQHPGKGGGTCSGQLLPAELQAEAGVVEAANRQRELQQVVLVFRFVPPSLQNQKERTIFEWPEGTSSGPTAGAGQQSFLHLRIPGSSGKETSSSVLALWVDHMKPGVRDQPWQHGETLSLLKMQKLATYGGRYL